MKAASPSLKKHCINYVENGMREKLSQEGGPLSDTSATGGDYVNYVLELPPDFFRNLFYKYYLLTVWFIS